MVRRPPRSTRTATPFPSPTLVRSARHRLAALLVFALPPLLALAGVLRGGTVAAKSAFWAGVLALFWFSHGVMIAWSHPYQAGWAWAEIALSLVVIVAGTWPGLHASCRPYNAVGPHMDQARFGCRHRGPPPRASKTDREGT